jgi:predicted metal-dependent phosphoesterase TrpH
MIDLHSHTTASDGTLSPKQLIHHAHETGLSALAVTDHDTLLGLSEARLAAQKLPIRFIPGVEIEINYPDGQFHLLGLGLEGDTSSLQDLLEQLQKSRGDRNLAMIHRLNMLGVEISLEQWMEEAAGGTPERPHLARLMVKKGLVKNTQKAFDDWLGPEGKVYLPKEGVDLAPAISAIHKAGGKAFLAHPQSIRKGLERLEGLLKTWQDLGLDGIEAYHPGTLLRVGRKYEALARSLGLRVSAGSDFHADNRKDRKLGRSSGGMVIEDRFLDELLA